MSGESKELISGLSRRSLMTATALASLAALAGCGGGDGAPAPVVPPPPPPPPAPVTSKFLYSGNDTGSSTAAISAFSLSATTGTLTGLTSPIGSPGNPGAALVHPTGKWAYFAGITDLGQFAVNQTTGILTPVGTLIPLPRTNAGYGTFMAMNPAGTLLYVSQSGTPGNIAKYSIDPTTGVPTEIFAGSSGGTGLANNRTLYLTVHPNGNFLYVSDFDDGFVYMLPILSGGELADSSAYSRYEANFPSQMVFNSAGTVMYTSKQNSVVSYHCDPSTGVLANAGSPTFALAEFTPQSTPTTSQPKHVAISPNGLFLYSEDLFPQVAVYPLLANGSIQPSSSSLITSGAITSIKINYTGTTMYVSSSAAHKIDVLTIAPNGSLTSAQSLATGNDPLTLAIANF